MKSNLDDEAQGEVRTVRLRRSPRISMNKLAEFAVESGSTRRHSIIADAIVERPFKRVTYEHARGGLKRFFANPAMLSEQLRRLASDFRDRALALPDEEETDRRSLHCSARALDSFALFGSSLKTKCAIAVPGGRTPAALEWSGVRVSVQPDVCFLKSGTEHRIGAVKFHFSVENRLSSKALKYAATLLHAYFISQDETPQSPLCIAVDVMAMEYESTPRASKTILKELQASCRDIAILWPEIFAEQKAKEEKRAAVKII